MNQEASIRYNQMKKANPGMTTNQALVASGAGSMVDLNNKLYDTGVSSADVPAFTPLDFGKQLLRQVVGMEANPNNLSSHKVLQLVRQGVSKPDFMQEYMRSGGKPPQHSVLTDSEYMEAYNTQQIPDWQGPLQEVPDDPGQEIKKEQPDYESRMPSYDSQPDPQPTGQQPMQAQAYVPPNHPQHFPDQAPMPQPTGQQPMQATVNPYSPPQPFQSVSPPSVSESLMQGGFETSLPMYSSPPTQQGYNYDSDVMTKLLQQIMSNQT
tara:strand:+ start:589 stop:1386 length:798 start_codon:yes stop_codon:yes gene_type:complete